MRKVFVILLTIVILFFGLILAVPYFFKGRIVELIKKKINQELVATVNFDNDIGLSLLRNFPNLSLTIDDLSVVGLDSFAGDTFMSMDRFHATIDLMSVIGGDEIRVKSISLNKPFIHAVVMESGRANWDIAKPSDAKDTAAEDTSGGDFKVALKKYEITDGTIIYEDFQSNMFARVVDLDHTGKGDFTQDVFVLSTITNIEALSFSMDDIPYLSDVNTELKADLDMNMPQMRFAFKENTLRLNALEIGFDGFVAMPADDIDMDLRVASKKTDFRDLISLIPVVYTKDFDKVKASGKMALNMDAKGTLNTEKEQYPAFNAGLQVDNGSFSYPDLPEKLNNVLITLKVNNRDGVLDNTVVDLSRLHFELGSEPFDARLLMKKPMSNPWIDAALKGRVDLTRARNLVPLDQSTKLAGLVSADLQAKGSVSAIEGGNYEAMDAKGMIQAENVVYAEPGEKYDVKLDRALLNFTPQKISLDQFSAMIGHSDLALKGTISNFFAYLLTDNGILNGNFDLSSNLFDVNTFMSGEEQKAEPSPSDTIPLEAFEVPANLDLGLKVAIGKLLYDNLVINNISGSTAIRNQQLILDNLSAGILQGNVKMSGYYDSKNIQNPATDLRLELSSIDIRESFERFNTVKKVAPVAGYLSGKLSAKLTYKSLLDFHMQPVLNTILSEGSLKTSQAVLSNFPPLVSLADKIKVDQFKQLVVSNTDLSYKVEDGRIQLTSDLKNKIDQVTFVVEKGDSTGFDQTLDYKMKVGVPRSMFGSGANQALDNLLGEIGKKGIDLKPSEVVNVNVLIGGTIKNPVITTSMKDLVKGAAENVLDKGREFVEDKKEEAIQKGKEELNKKITEAEKKGDQLIADARKQADQLKAEARKQGDALIAEADKQAQNLLNEAGGNPLKKIAAEKAGEKLKSEARDKANRLNSEAEQKGNDLIRKAEDQKKKLVEDARNQVK